MEAAGCSPPNEAGRQEAGVRQSGRQASRLACTRSLRRCALRFSCAPAPASPEFNALRLRACSTYQIARAAVRERGSRRTIVPAPGPSCGCGLHGGGDGGAGGGSKTRRNSEARWDGVRIGAVRRGAARLDGFASAGFASVEETRGKMRGRRERRGEKEERCSC